MGCGLHQFVLADELEGLLEAEPPRRGEVRHLVGGGRAHVRELFFLGDVHVQVVGPGVFSDDHTLVDVLAGGNEEGTPGLEVLDGICGGTPRSVCHQGAGEAVGDVPLPGLVAVEQVVHDAAALGLGQELGAEAEQAPGGDSELEAHPAGAVVDHLDHVSLAGTHLLGQGTDEFLGRINDQSLHGLVEDAVDGTREDLWLAYRHLVALPPHHFNKDGHLELAPP